MVDIRSALDEKFNDRYFAGQVKSCGALLVKGIDMRARVEEKLGGVGSASSDGHHEWRLVAGNGCVRVSAALDKEICHRCCGTGVASRNSGEKRGLFAFFHAGIYLRTVVEEIRRDVEMTGGRGVVEWCPAVRCSGVDTLA